MLKSKYAELYGTILEEDLKTRDENKKSILKEELDNKEELGLDKVENEEKIDSVEDILTQLHSNVMESLDKVENLLIDSGKDIFEVSKIRDQIEDSLSHLIHSYVE